MNVGRRLMVDGGGRDTDQTIYSMRIPLIALAMTSCWISLVPSKIVWILASRCQRSTGELPRVVVATEDLIASSVTRTDTSDAVYFLIEPSAMAYPPLWASQAARHTSSQAASHLSVVMFASLKWPVDILRLRTARHAGVKARELSGISNMLFLRDGQTGAVEARPRAGGSGQGLNTALHHN